MHTVYGHALLTSEKTISDASNNAPLPCLVCLYRIVPGKSLRNDSNRIRCGQGTVFIVVSMILRYTYSTVCSIIYVYTCTMYCMIARFMRMRRTTWRHSSINSYHHYVSKEELNHSSRFPQRVQLGLSGILQDRCDWSTLQQKRPGGFREAELVRGFRPRNKRFCKDWNMASSSSTPPSCTTITFALLVRVWLLPNLVA